MNSFTPLIYYFFNPHECRPYKFLLGHKQNYNPETGCEPHCSSRYLPKSYPERQYRQERTSLPNYREKFFKYGLLHSYGRKYYYYRCEQCHQLYQYLRICGLNIFHNPNKYGNYQQLTYQEPSRLSKRRFLPQ